MRCDHCSNEVPDGVFCTRCGAHQGTTKEIGDPKTREHRYAAHPGEHVAQPSVFTTLFPHLGHHKIHEFRWAFIAGLGGILVLYLAGLISAAILVSAFLVPVLYLIYLYEAQVYRDEPALVLGFTLGGGIIVGIVATIFERIIYNPFQYSGNPFGNAGVSLGGLLIVGLLFPVVQEALKALPALFLLPLLQGSATGMIAATIWRYRRGRLAGREIGGVAMALLAHIAFSAGTQVMKDTSVNPLFILIWQAAIVGALLIYIRYLLHHSLLEEAAHMGYAETVCPSCHMHIVASGFCPNCGMALTAAPNSIKRGRRPRVESPVSAEKR